MTLSNSNPATWLPDLIYTNGRFASKLALVCDDTIAHLAGRDEVENAIRLKGRALLPGLPKTFTTPRAWRFWKWR